MVTITLAALADPENPVWAKLLQDWNVPPQAADTLDMRFSATSQKAAMRTEKVSLAQCHLGVGCFTQRVVINAWVGIVAG